MEKIKIINELKSVRDSVNITRFEKDRNFIENKLSQNLETVISYLKEDLMSQAQAGSPKCSESIFLEPYEVNHPLPTFDLSKINDIYIRSALIKMYSLESREGKLVCANASYVIRKSSLFERLQEEGLEYLITNIDNGIIVTTIALLESDDVKKKIKK